MYCSINMDILVQFFFPARMFYCSVGYCKTLVKYLIRCELEKRKLLKNGVDGITL